MIWIAAAIASVGAGWLLGGGDASVNGRTFAEMSSQAFLVSLLGVTVGLCVRDRVRLGHGYASPTLGWLGKRLLLASLCGAATFALSPVAWPSGCVPAFAAATALGGLTWLGNLPTKL